MITNTHSVGVVRDAVLEWMRDRHVVDELAPGGLVGVARCG